MIVTIDGGVASGKSAVGRRVAEVLGVPFVDSGLMYRAITRLAIERGGHVRVGLEDYAGDKTPPNVQLVEEVVKIARDVGRPIADPTTVFNRPTVMRRYFPQLAAAGQSRPPVNELTMSLTDNLAIVDVWAGSAELRMPEVQGEEMHLIAPLRVGRGYHLGMAYSVTDLRILKNYAV